ncbi:2735_t:CDS:1, partial [Gigaspora rosea]
YGKQQSKLSQESQQDNNQEHHHSDQKKTPRDTSNDLDMFAKYLVTNKMEQNTKLNTTLASKFLTFPNLIFVNLY